MTLLAAVLLTSTAQAAGPALGTAGSFAVLAGSTVTNTGPSVISGDLGVSPGTAVTGFPPGMLSSGAVHSADAATLQAQTDLTTAYDNASGLSGGSAIVAPLGGGTTLVAGVYTSAADIFVGGDLTLDGGGDPNAVFVFQAKTGTLITAAGTSSGVPNTRVLLRNGAQACNVFWQVGSSATIETSTQFAGNILALQSISMNTGATLYGRALARNAAVTLDTNRITQATCAAQSAAAPTASSTSATTAAGQPVTISLFGNDATGAPLTYTIASGPSHGMLAAINQGAGTVAYTPNAGYAGSDTFTYQVTTSNGVSPAATGTITISPAGTGSTTGTTGSGTATGTGTTTGTTGAATTTAPVTGTTTTTTGAATTTGTGPGTGTTTGATTGTGTSTTTSTGPSTTTGTGAGTGTSTTTGATTSTGTTTGTTTAPGLPVTGLNVLWLLACAAALVLAGATLRRFATGRQPDD